MAEKLAAVKKIGVKDTRPLANGTGGTLFDGEGNTRRWSNLGSEGSGTRDTQSGAGGNRPPDRNRDTFQGAMPEPGPDGAGEIMPPLEGITGDDEGFRKKLELLREQYERAQHDEFSDEELSRLSFVRWLYRSGRLSA